MSDPFPHRHRIVAVARATAVVSALAASLPGVAASAQTAPAHAADDRDAEVVVTGAGATGFTSDSAGVGIFRDQSLLATPLTVTVINRALIDAQDARTTDDVLRNVAGVTLEALSPTVTGSFSSRGIRILPRTNFRLNGALPIINYLQFPLENKERVEVLKGVSALYYGFSAPSAIVNFVTKRAGDVPVLTARVDGDVEGSYGIGLDAGRRQGRFGARLNGYIGHQETPIDGIAGHRSMVSAALDFDPTDRLSLRFDAEHYERRIGEPGSILIPAAVGAVGGIGGTVTLPAIPDPHNNYGPRGTDFRGYATNLLAHAGYRFAPGWELRADAGMAWTDRNRWIFGVRVDNPATGAGTLVGNYMGDEGYENRNLRVELAGGLKTGPVSHALTLGYVANRLTDVVHTTRAFSTPQNVRVPLRPDAASLKLAAPVLFPVQYTHDSGVYALDQATLGPVTVIGGLRAQRYRFDKAGSALQAVDTVTSTGGVIVRPSAATSLYVSYIEGLESAGNAPDGTVNAGEMLPALVSRQWEAGAKYQTGRLLLTAAAFTIDRALAYANAQRVYVTDGRARHRGIELSAQGSLAPGLSLAVTGQYLEAIQLKTSNAAQNGKPIINAPRWAGSAFMEYRPHDTRLGLSAGVYYTGRRYADVQGRASIAGYALASLGASYDLPSWHGARTRLQVTADNVLDKRYWATAGDANLYPGLPRTVRFAVTTAF